MARQANVADKHENLDVTTLKEVERLLTSTEFASANDLIARGGAVEPTIRTDAADEVIDADDGAPLPKRR